MKRYYQQQTKEKVSFSFIFIFPITKFAPLLMFLKSLSYVNMELINCLAVEP